MASLYVLYINDKVVGPCLELVRKVCEPNSKSKSHVTLRGPIRKQTRKELPWRDLTISEIDLIEPGSFFSKTGDLPEQNTVFVRCGSEQLWQIHYTPDYYTRLPHITLYDGNSRDFAEKLLADLRKYTWNFKVHLPKHWNERTRSHTYPTLTEIRLKGKNTPRKAPLDYQPKLKKLFSDITSRKLEYDYLKNLNDKKRLELVSLIFDYIEKKTTRKSDIKDRTDKLMLNSTNTDGTQQRIGSLGKEQKPKIEKRQYTSGGRQQELRLLESVQAKANAKSRELRSKLGQFLTPPELAIEIAQYIEKLLPRPFSPIHFGDPAIGTGTFFSALRQVFPSKCIATAFGVEIDKTIASMTQTLWSNQGLQVVEGDYFSIEPLPKRNIILSNPPYVRHHYIPKVQKASLRKQVRNRLAIDVSGLSSLYVYFILLCHHWMENEAIAAWLVPTEFMQVNYGAAIRQYLTENVSPILIHRFDPKEVQFDGVLVASSIVVFRNRPPESNQTTRFSYGGSLLTPKKIEEISISKLRSFDKWPMNLRFFNANRSPSSCLSELFTIRRGIATGANSFFILTREEAQQHEIPESCLRPILPGPRKLSGQIVQRETDGYPRINPQHVLIDCPLPEIEVRKRYPQLWEYLQTAEHHGIRERYLVRNRNPWYRQEQRQPPLYLCTYLGREGPNGGPFRFIWNRSDAIATNVYLLLYPRAALATLIKERPEFQELIFDLLQKTSKSALRDGGRVYGGGLYKIEPRELGAIGADALKRLIC